MKNILNKELPQLKSRAHEVVKNLHELTISIGQVDLANTVSELRNRISEPFMFVIVGEVKAGKSSFINALLSAGKEVCAVAPHPMTDTIQQILYGEKEETIDVNQYLKKIFQPVEILKEIAIVDTPGTNTIVEHHQEITERFVPSSDLIVFVFEAKNPYRQSSWEFFDYINEEWRKKILFVLQQKDLVAPDDLLVNIQGVKDHAKKKGIAEPKVFAVSAKDELEGRANVSGFGLIKDYIYKNITGGQAPFLKLQNNIVTSRKINEQIYKGLQDRVAQYKADIIFRDDIRSTLDDQEDRSAKQVDVLVENLVAAYDRITRKTENELTTGLSFFTIMKRSFKSIFNKRESAKEWLQDITKELETGLNTELKDKLNEGVVDIAESIQQMAKIIDLKIRNSKNILQDNHEIFADIAERRANVLKDLQATFSSFLKNSENFIDEELFPDKDSLTPNLAAGGVLTIVGIITTLVNGAVFDITGGILTAVGVVFAGVSVGYKKRKLLKSYNAEINKGRTKLEQEVSEKLKAYIRRIKIKIDQNFNQFDELLGDEKDAIGNLESQHSAIEQELNEMEDKLNPLLS